MFVKTHSLSILAALLVAGCTSSSKHHGGNNITIADGGGSEAEAEAEAESESESEGGRADAGSGFEGEAEAEAESEGGGTACAADPNSAACAACVRSSCSSERMDCMSSAGCAAFARCIQGCGMTDMTCQNGCVDTCNSDMTCVGPLCALYDCLSTDCGTPPLCMMRPAGM